MREYVMQDWTFVIGLMVVVILSILCQLSMIYHINSLIKEREEMSDSEKEKTGTKCKQSGVANPCKKVAILAFTML